MPKSINQHGLYYPIKHVWEISLAWIEKVHSELCPLKMQWLPTLHWSCWVSNWYGFVWPKNILYLLLNDLYLILWGIPIKNNSHFKTCINYLYLKESVPFTAKFWIGIEIRFVKRGSPPAIRWTVSRTCSDLSCRMITSPSNWSISPRSLD